MLTNMQHSILLCTHAVFFPLEDRVLKAIYTYSNRYQCHPRISEVAARVHGFTPQEVKHAVMEIAKRGLVLLIEDKRSLRCRIEKHGYLRLAEIAKEMGAKA